MEKQVISKLKVDIKNAEKFFNRTGEAIKEAYQCVDSNIDKVNENGAQNIFLYIPEADDDMYVIYSN